MITLIRQTYQQLTPQRQAEFSILGFYTLVCWLISAYGSYLFVLDYTEHIGYALLTPLFVELLAAAATWLYVRGSTLWITWLRFLIVPALIISVAHLFTVTTPAAPWMQYAVGVFLAALFGYGQHYVDNAIRHSDENAQLAHTAAYDAQRRRLEHEQARILADAQLSVLRLTHLEHTRNAVRDALTEAIIPTADYQIAETPATAPASNTAEIPAWLREAPEWEIKERKRDEWVDEWHTLDTLDTLGSTRPMGFRTAPQTAPTENASLPVGTGRNASLPMCPHCGSPLPSYAHKGAAARHGYCPH